MKQAVAGKNPFPLAEENYGGEPCNHKTNADCHDHEALCADLGLLQRAGGFELLVLNQAGIFFKCNLQLRDLLASVQVEDAVAKFFAHPQKVSGFLEFPPAV